MNYVLMSSAAVGSGDTLLLTFQDVVELMNQIFMNPAAPLVFLVVLLLSSHIISLSSIIGSHAIVENFFGVNLSLSAHHLLLKVFAMIPTIYYAKIAGSEAIYQLLIICPVIQAMLLPSSVIPVFRVASSRSLMGSYRISSSVEILAFLAFLLMLFTNIIFMAEILFGDSTWTNNMKGNTGSPVVLPYTLIVLISCVSITFTLFLAVTPLKSASNEAETLELSVHSEREQLVSTHHREELSLEDVAHEEVERSSPDALRDSMESHQKSVLEHTESSDTTVESDQVTQQSTGYTVGTPKAQPLPPVYREEPKPVCVSDWTESIPKVSFTSAAVEHINAENIKVKNTTEKDVEVVAEVCTDKDNVAPRNLEYEKSAGGRAPFNPDGPPSLTFSRGKDSDAGNGSGSLSTLSGLGRAARKQLAATLDEFWGHLFDYHGKLTQDASDKRYNFLLGLDSKTASSAVRADNQTTEASKSPLMRDTMRGSPTSLNSWDSMSRDKDIRSLDWNSGHQMGAMGSSNWSQSMNSPYRDISSPSSSLLEQNAKYYSNFNVPSYSDNQFYQPATVHGYQLASYLKEMNASRSQYSNIPLDPRRVPRSSEYSFSNYPDSALHARSQNVRGSLGANPLQSPTMNRLNATVERPYYDSNSVEESENAGSSAYSKKYHSSPDMSAIIAAASRQALLNEANLGGAAGNQSYLSKLASERSQYLDPTARSNTQVAFSERSQHNLQRDALSMFGMNPNTKSLWAQQPFEQLFGVSSAELNKSEVNTGQRSSGITKDDSSYTECEAELLQSLRLCIINILKLEGSGWLFRQNGGCDENLIDQVAAAERFQRNDERAANCTHGLPNCGETCVWQGSLVSSFGVWCIRRVLDLSFVESRPELWGKYTYVLNRLQGILEPAFSKPRKPLTGCACLQIVGPVARPISGTFTTSAVILETIKDVEQAISGRKGRSGTAAGDVAFPKGKENLASVLKRYKRRLSSKPSGGQ